MLLQLKLNEAVKYKKLLIKLVNIKDERCPREMLCIWQGQVIISLLINDVLYQLSSFDGFIGTKIIVNNNKIELVYVSLDKPFIITLNLQ